jgi:hypothetical protein
MSKPPAFHGFHFPRRRKISDAGRCSHVELLLSITFDAVSYLFSLRRFPFHYSTFTAIRIQCAAAMGEKRNRTWQPFRDKLGFARAGCPAGSADSGGVGSLIPTAWRDNVAAAVSGRAPRSSEKDLPPSQRLTSVTSAVLMPQRIGNPVLFDSQSEPKGGVG